MTDLAEKSFGPRPNDQTMLPDLSTSMTRLLNWSAIRMLPGSLNSRFNLGLSAETVFARTMTPMVIRTEHQAPLNAIMLMFFVFIGLFLLLVVNVAIGKSNETHKSSRHYHPVYQRGGCARC